MSREKYQAVMCAVPRKYQQAVPKKYQQRDDQGPLGHQSKFPASIYDCQSIGRSDFPEHPVDVVFHRLLGEIQVRRDLLICESPGNQRNQLLLSTR